MPPELHGTVLKGAAWATCLYLPQPPLPERAEEMCTCVHMCLKDLTTIPESKKDSQQPRRSGKFREDTGRWDRLLEKRSRELAALCVGSGCGSHPGSPGEAPSSSNRGQTVHRANIGVHP